MVTRGRRLEITEDMVGYNRYEVHLVSNFLQDPGTSRLQSPHVELVIVEFFGGEWVKKSLFH